ncbi:DUF1292 domain-containing protein [Haploplasma axanthum]|uniref:Uncharacterized protein conserved in bacteria n=1 Tax=Haploplasma axanthum TaxID=29552 RepID=A0A449BDY1_HAPAX|nr:DUF1292 domain-containing protein [Haploplasma axanthum]VEU80663.1 Uncharacterized protein conserved in bacteria [Haploplasma axanthum]
MDENQITLITEDGKEELATILFTHEENGKKYVVFELVESGDVSAARYSEDGSGEGKVLDIETDEEWAMLDELLDQYYDSLDDEDEEFDESDDEI